MFKFYRMSYQVAKVQELDCSLEDAFDIARDEFWNCSSCCQVIIDEENCIIFSLLNKAYLSEEFEYKLQDKDYQVYDCGVFDDINEIKLIQVNYRGKK